jgi:anti-sigma-K factor RskA
VTVDHEDLRSDCALYVVGALDASERTRLEEHARTCDECRASLRSFGAVADLLPYAVSITDPPPHLRERILAAASRARSPRVAAPPVMPGTPAVGRPRRALVAMGGWVVAAASLVVAVAFGMRTADQLARVRGMLALVTAPDTLELRLTGQPPATQARARAFLSRSRGVLFAASDLPPIRSDRTYQVWYLTRGAPVSAGLITPDADGNATATFALPNEPAITGMAVSLEPDGGVPAPTGAIYLATP